MIKNSEKSQDLEKISTVPLSDILHYSVASTFVLKLDIEGFDCKVTFEIEISTFNPSILLHFQTLSSKDIFQEFYIPFIFHEWKSTDQSCLELVPHLLSLGYIPYW